jgi:preprotein translocase subunit YajC
MKLPQILPMSKLSVALGLIPAFMNASYAQAGQPPQPNPLMSLVPFVVMMAVVYFLIIRPQQKKMKEHQSALEKLKTGDEVVTQSGIFGTITGITGKVVTLEVDKGVKLKVLKSQINILGQSDQPNPR